MNLIKKLVRIIWMVFFLSFFFLILFVLGVRYDTFGWFGGLPSLDDLERPDPNQSSELISADGVVLGKYFRQNRTPVSYHELSPELINTLLVTEDIRFKEHSGIDLKGLVRAALSLGSMGGGSTITMQLAENLYKTSTENTGSLYRFRKIGFIITKVKEWIIAVQLEKSYTKEEILAMYLNTIEFGSNSYGIKVAAQTFFNKLPAQLNYQESATLIGALNAPTRYSPILNPENAMNKRTEVLYNVHKYGLLSKTDFDSIKQLPFGLNYRVNNQNEGLAPYFRKVAGNFLRDWCNEHGFDLYEDGLKVYTTLDSRMQAIAENAVHARMKELQATFDAHVGEREPWIDDYGRPIKKFLQNAIKRTESYRSLVRKYGKDSDSVEYYLNKPKAMQVFSWEGPIDTVFSSYDSLAYFKKFLHAGFMAMEPSTGHIKAWVGGINHRYFKYDHVKQGKRQPGSTFKPFVYTAAMEHGYTPCWTVTDIIQTYEIPNQPPWSPTNATGKVSNESMTVRQAMARSLNTITAYVAMEWVSPQIIVDYARKMGITSEIEAVPSLALGAGGDVSLFEMVGAYGTFVNKGVHTVPFFITRIEDKNGNVVHSFPKEQTEAINENTAYIMLHMLKGTSEEEGGTALGLDRELRWNHDIGAKTGTTNNASDGWFMGFTKDLVAGAWVLCCGPWS
jgi:penicillin-binding protein 1A